MLMSTTNQQTTTDADKKKGIKKSHSGLYFDRFRLLAIIILAVSIIRWSVASICDVPTVAMEPTIKAGDRIFAWQLAYNFKVPFTNRVIATWGAPRRGDIILFNLPKDTNINHVQRVGAVAGDEVALIDNVLYINGKAQQLTDFDDNRVILDEIEDDKDAKILFRENLEGVDHWLMHNKPNTYRPASNYPAKGVTHRVPEGFAFVIGDNRDSSSDSRIWGDVPLEYVRGKAVFVVWSVFRPRGGGPWKFRADRFGQAL